MVTRTHEHHPQGNAEERKALPAVLLQVVDPRSETVATYRLPTYTEEMLTTATLRDEAIGSFDQRGRGPGGASAISHSHGRGDPRHSHVNQVTVARRASTMAGSL
jgi:hypothetical protein